MIELKGMTVVGELTAAVDSELARSRFFSGLREGRHGIDQVGAVFGQYYLWRNVFHRWFGVCIARSPAFGSGRHAPYILSELAHHIDEEISGDHHAMCRTFLDAIGVDATSVEALPVTQAYCDSFVTRYMDPERTGEEALAALAGRELVAPARNRMIIDALSTRYGVDRGLEFFGLHEELEEEHFEGMWDALSTSKGVDPRRLVDAAKVEIVDHVQFWDDVLDAVTSTRRPVAAGAVPTA